MARIIQKISLVLAIVFLIAKIILMTAIVCYPEPAIPKQKTLEITPQEVVELTNNYRQSKNLNPLKINPRLNQAAVNKARDLLAGQYFAHRSPDGKDFSRWIEEVNYPYFYVGENLAINFQDSRKMFQAWLDSPSHQENIVRPQFQEIGVSVVKGKFKNQQAIIVVQLFGSKISTGGQEFPQNPLDNLEPQSLSRDNFWQRAFSLENLEKIELIVNYLLIVFIGLAVISYQPPKKINQPNIKQPITSRYQAKSPKE